MATFKRFEDIIAWQKARDLDKLVFKLIQKEKFSKEFRLIDQMKASSGSVMDNIAEGFEREGTKEFLQFLSISKGSLAELKSQTYRSFDRMYISQDEFENVHQQIQEIKGAISGLMEYLKKTEIKGIKYQK